MGIIPSSSIQPPELSIVREAALRALGEDRGPVDITSFALIDPSLSASARIFAKQEGVLAGIVVAEVVFREVNSQFVIEHERSDGESVEKGETLLRIHGSARDLLTAERTALNFIQHLSGIATETRRYVQAVQHTKARILDTRKTVPGLRALEKYAVRCGGGMNHRMGLYDQFMIKDNHISLMQANGGLAEAVQRARTFDATSKLTVEAETLDQVHELVHLQVGRILLDNMSNEQLAEAVKIVAGQCETEASGNMSLERVASVAETGVDFISVGALTHSARALDISLEILSKRH